MDTETINQTLVNEAYAAVRALNPSNADIGMLIALLRAYEDGRGPAAESKRSVGRPKGSRKRVNGTVQAGKEAVG